MSSALALGSMKQLVQCVRPQNERCFIHHNEELPSTIDLPARVLTPYGLTRTRVNGPRYRGICH
eukprot:8597142-Lingulodinium_polyedra.AAC.1